MQSKELTEFYRAYAKWLDEGAPDRAPFRRDVGLCANTSGYSDDVYFELINQFKAAGLDEATPFNPKEAPGIIKDTYWIETAKGHAHLNPHRIKWVRDHAAIT